MILLELNLNYCTYIVNSKQIIQTFFLLKIRYKNISVGEVGEFGPERLGGHL